MIEQLLEISDAFFRDLFGPGLASFYGVVKFIHLMTISSDRGLE